MADFAPNFTARYRIRYSSLGKSHSMVFRVGSAIVDPSGIATKVGLFLGDLEGLLYEDWTLIGADFAPADSDVFLPATPPAAPDGGALLSSAHPSDAAASISFVGRSSAGGKARMFLYGTNIGAVVRLDTGNDWKLTSAENSLISDAVVRLNETSPVLVANDDHAAVWYEYVNIKYNDRWVRRLRRG